MEKPTHVRFYVDLTSEDNRSLVKLAGALTAKMGVRITRPAAIRLAIRSMLKDQPARPEREVIYEQST